MNKHWALIDSRGTLRLDARLTLETDNGVLIYAQCRSVISPIDSETVAKVIAGPIAPRAFDFRTAPIFETGDERYTWLNERVCVAVGTLTDSGVAYDVFGV